MHFVDDKPDMSMLRKSSLSRANISDNTANVGNRDALVNNRSIARI